MKYKTTHCANCGKLFERAIGKINGGISSGLKEGARSFKSITCSKKCARIYNY